MTLASAFNLTTIESLMTQQPYETAEPTGPTVYSRPVRVIAFGLFAVLSVGVGNVIYSARHQPKPVTATTSAWVLRQQRDSINAQLALMNQAQATTPDPNVFDEKRDGSETIFPEDENGKASIWKDTTTGSRIFCLDSCIVLPASHRHRHHHQ